MLSESEEANVSESGLPNLIVGMLLGALITRWIDENPEGLNQIGQALMTGIERAGQWLEDHPEEYEELLKLLTPQDLHLPPPGRS